MKMNYKNIIPLLFISSSLLLTACQKDTDVFIPDPGQVSGPDTNWVATITAGMPVTILQNNLLLETYTDSFEVNANLATVNATAAGLNINFPPFCCQRPNGLTVSGKVYLELLLLKNKGDMIRMARPTSSNNRLLVSGGSFFIKLKKDGEELQLKPNTYIQVKFADPQPSPLMKVFYGDESNPNQFNWLPADTAGTASQVIAGNQFYQLYSRNLRWVNCDYFYDTTGANRVKIQTELPAHFTNANTSVYLVFNEMRTVVGMYGEPTVKKFISGKVPVGKPITIVVISKQGNDYYLGKQISNSGLNVTGNSNQSVPITPIKTGLADIKAYLGTL